MWADTLAPLGLVAVTLLAGSPVETPEGQRSSIRVKTIAASARQLVAKADRAFIGTVASVSIAKERLKDVDQPVAVKTVSFRVERVLFDRTGRVSANATLALRLLAEGSRPVKEGERLLWYVAPDTEDGLTQPVGIDSGHFRFTADGASVINLKQNENLLEPATIEGQAEALAQEVPETRRGEFRTRMLEWAATARTTPAGQPVPLELLVARTSQLSREAPPQ